MFNQKQIESIAKLSYKIAEILIAGVVISGFMQPELPVGKIILGMSLVPLPIIVGLGLESGEGQQEPPRC